MLRAAPKMARLNDAIAAGERFELGISGEVAEAANKMSELRSKGQTAADFLDQSNLFEGRNTLVDRLIDTFDRNKRSPKVIGEVLTRYVDAVDALGSPNQTNLFGAGPQPNRSEILAAAIKLTEKANAPPGRLFEEGATSFLRQSAKPRKARQPAQPPPPPIAVAPSKPRPARAREAGDGPQARRDIQQTADEVGPPAPEIRPLTSEGADLLAGRRPGRRAGEAPAPELSSEGRALFETSTETKAREAETLGADPAPKPML